MADQPAAGGAAAAAAAAAGHDTDDDVRSQGSESSSSERPNLRHIGRPLVPPDDPSHLVRWALHLLFRDLKDVPKEVLRRWREDLTDDQRVDMVRKAIRAACERVFFRGRIDLSLPPPRPKLKAFPLRLLNHVAKRLRLKKIEGAGFDEDFDIVGALGDDIVVRTTFDDLWTVGDAPIYVYLRLAKELADDMVAQRYDDPLWAALNPETLKQIRAEAQIPMGFWLADSQNSAIVVSQLEEADFVRTRAIKLGIAAIEEARAKRKAERLAAMANVQREAAEVMQRARARAEEAASEAAEVERRGKALQERIANMAKAHVPGAAAEAAPAAAAAAAPLSGAKRKAEENGHVDVRPLSETLALRILSGSHASTNEWLLYQGLTHERQLERLCHEIDLRCKRFYPRGVVEPLGDDPKTNGIYPLWCKLLCELQDVLHGDAAPPGAMYYDPFLEATLHLGGAFSDGSVLLRASYKDTPLKHCPPFYLFVRVGADYANALFAPSLPPTCDWFTSKTLHELRAQPSLDDAWSKIGNPTIWASRCQFPMPIDFRAAERVEERAVDAMRHEYARAHLKSLETARGNHLAAACLLRRDGRTKRMCPTHSSAAAAAAAADGQ